MLGDGGVRERYVLCPLVSPEGDNIKKKKLIRDKENIPRHNSVFVARDPDRHQENCN